MNDYRLMQQLLMDQDHLVHMEYVMDSTNPYDYLNHTLYYHIMDYDEFVRQKMLVMVVVVVLVVNPFDLNQVVMELVVVEMELLMHL